MEKELKMYVNESDLNEQEKKTGLISYKRLINRISSGIWLFNNAPKLSEYDFEFEIGSDYNEEDDEYIDIYQYYLIDINPYMIEKLQEIGCQDVIIAWSENLEEYVLFVDHFGTSWDYVSTSIKWTTNIKESDLQEG